MRALRFLNVAILSALVGCASFVYAQDEKPTEDKPAKQEEPKPQPKQDEAKPAHQNDAKPAAQDKEQEKQEQKRDQDQTRDQMKPAGQEHPDQPMEHARPEAQAQGARPAGKGGHIPDDKFKSNFGNGHHFRAQGVIVQGQSQFQYGGYNFQLVDAWPVGWAYTDDCYIDYIDGEYFLFDLLHPGVRIAIVVVL